MSGYKKIPKEIKEEVLSRIKQGHKVPELAQEYGISKGAIYTWLRDGVVTKISALEFSRMRRERDDLLKLVGNLTLEVEKRKKKRGY
ncbi:MAG: helix-turn-helix domain-containing protein [Bdellovibrionales bacterium]|jgi:Mor family transcriptional regulator|nr:helix-turn-helix domain-containing protein [Bdellovibrionales bacterium]